MGLNTDEGKDFSVKRERELSKRTTLIKEGGILRLTILFICSFQVMTADYLASLATQSWVQIPTENSVSRSSTPP